MITVELDEGETELVDLQRLVNDLGEYVRFQKDWSSEQHKRYADVFDRSKSYEILQTQKRYGGYNPKTSKPFLDEVDGVIVTIEDDTGTEHDFGYEWFVENPSAYKK